MIEKTEEKDTRFPLTPCGNDNGGKPGRLPSLSFPPSLSVLPAFPLCPSRPPPFLSFPTSSIGNPRIFPLRGRMIEKTEEKDTRFPLTPCRNDNGGKPGRTIPPLSFPTFSKKRIVRKVFVKT